MQGNGRSRGSVVPLSIYLLVITMATFAIGVVQAANVVQLPFGEWFSKLTGSILSSSSLNAFMTNYGYASLFVLMALESASVPIPSEVVLPFAGYLAYAGVLNFWVAIGVSTLASLAGALVDYYLALWLGRPFVVGLLKIFRLHSGALDRAEGWFKRSGQWTVFAARFVPGLRTIISLPAGLFEMDVIRFVTMTVAGCFAWSVVLVYAGFLAGSASSTAFASSAAVVQGLSALVAAVSAAYIAYYGIEVYRGSSRGSTLPSSGS